MFLTQNHTPKTWQKFNQSLIFQFFLNSISGFLRGGRVSSGDEGIFENILFLLNSPYCSKCVRRCAQKPPCTLFYSFPAAVQQNGAVGNVHSAAIITHVCSVYHSSLEIVNVPCIFVIVLVFLHLSLYLHSFTAAVRRNGAVGNVHRALPLTHM